MYDAMAEAIETANGDVADPLHPDLRRAGRVLGRQRSGGFPEGRDRRRGARQAVLRFLHALARCEKPLVAAVQGVAVGIGTTMLLHCDYVVAASDARFSTPFVASGLVPEAASSLLAPRLMGHRRAFALLVMGKPLERRGGEGAGLVNQVAPADQVEPRR